MNWLFSWQGLADIIWFVFLLGLLWHFWQERKVLQDVSHWLITKGRITEFVWSKDGVHVWPKIEYSYEVFDQEFHGEHFFVDTKRNNPNSKYARKLAYHVAIAYEKNEEITVYYNPDNPVQSALDVRIPTKLNVIIGLVLFLLGLHLVIVMLRQF